jgi:hypothetical protein
VNPFTPTTTPKGTTMNGKIETHYVGDGHDHSNVTTAPPNSQPLAVLHLGVKPVHLLDVMNYLNPDYPVTIDGDGWEEWGAKPGVRRNDHDTLHLTVLIDRPDESATVTTAMQIVLDLDEQQVLTPMLYSGMVVACLTDDGNWTAWMGVEDTDGPEWYWQGHAPGDRAEGQPRPRVDALGVTTDDGLALDRLASLITAEGEDTDLGSDFIGEAVAIVKGTGRTV